MFLMTRGTTWFSVALSLGLGFAALRADLAKAQITGTPTHQVIPNKKFAAASVRAPPGLQCKLHAAGTLATSGLTVFIDDDGFARFQAVRANAGGPASQLTLDCTDAAGSRLTYAVDLTSDATFAARPLNLAAERGTDRQALKGDPLSFSQLELIQRGYGLRPDPTKNPTAYSRWLAAASVDGRMLEAKRPDLHSHTVTTTTSPWWLGSALAGAPNYISSEAVFNVTAAIPGGDETTTTEVAIWNCLGGFVTGSGLIQGGVSLYTTATAAVYGTWREYCCGDPDSNSRNDTAYGGNFTLNPGDSIFSQEWYRDAQGNLNLNGGFGCTYLVDMATGAVFSCTSSISSPCWSAQALPLCTVSPGGNCMALGRAAEFIIENQRPQVGTSTAFTDFTPTVTMLGSAYSSSTNSCSQTISTDSGVTLLTDFTNATTHINVTLGTTGQTLFTMSPAYGVGATIWSYTGARCSGTSCPGRHQLDNNPDTVTVLVGDSRLYQLHNSGKIWLSTGVGCYASSCPGWQMLDDNIAELMIGADSTNLYQLHNTGKIWRYTGTPCSGSSCPGWQRLDDNVAALAIAADSGGLYQLHNTGKIWGYTGTPCNGSSCPGWQMLDNNTAAVAIAASGQLYQLHVSCSGWIMLDNNPRATAIAAGSGQLYQLHNGGSIWHHNGAPRSGSSCPGWIELDNNSAATAIAAADNQLFQLHNDGSIWRHNGTPCSGTLCNQRQPHLSAPQRWIDLALYRADVQQFELPWMDPAGRQHQRAQHRCRRLQLRRC